MASIDAVAANDLTIDTMSDIRLRLAADNLYRICNKHNNLIFHNCDNSGSDHCKLGNMCKIRLMY